MGTNFAAIDENMGTNLQAFRTVDEPSENAKTEIMLKKIFFLNFLSIRAGRKGVLAGCKTVKAGCSTLRHMLCWNTDAACSSVHPTFLHFPTEESSSFVVVTNRFEKYFYIAATYQQEIYI